MKDLLTGLENLRLDTQTLRDFQTAVRSAQISEEPYKHILVTLKSQLDRVFQGSAEPAAVQLLLSRLDKKLQADLHGTKDVQPRQVVMTEEELQKLITSQQPIHAPPPTPTTANSDLSEEILHQLRLVTEEVKGIKDKQFHTISPMTHNDSVESLKKGPDLVFVSPIDETKVNQLKTDNVSIESKTSSKNLKDKIKKLRELKRGKE